MEEIYYTYVLKSKRDSHFYVGYTENLKLRFEAHECGNVKSTKNRRPFFLIYFEGCKSKDDALKREKYLKTFYGRMYIKNRLKSYFTRSNI